MIFASIQEDLDRIGAWANLNRLRLNAMKSQVMVIGSNSLLRSNTTFPTLILNDHPITFNSSVKNLAIDQTLSWKNASDISCSTFSTLKRLNYLYPFKTRRLLVTSLIFSHFGYRCTDYTEVSLWGSRGKPNTFEKFLCTIHLWDPEGCLSL